jgi:glucosamine kinase
VTKTAPSVTAPAGVLLGADVGGTATRVALATVGGEVLSLATGPAGNPISVGLEVSAGRIRSVAGQCLAQAGAVSSTVTGLRAAVIGLAGGSGADEEFGASALPAALGVRPRLVSDLSVAFSSATPAAEGYVLVAGTGAVAGRILDGELRERRDGWGWLLGDEGSGFWLGREVVRATLARLQCAEPLGPLARAVVEIAGTADPGVIVRLCYARPPLWLATFGALISRYADDPDAVAIADRAADHLAETLLGLGPRADLPVVLAGSVVTRPGPVRAAVTHRLDRALANPVLTAESGVVGALWLAAREIGLTDATIHARLARSARRTSGTVV